MRAVLGLGARIACLRYSGDAGVMLRLGYDAEANLRRGRALREAEGRQ